MFKSILGVFFLFSLVNANLALCDESEDNTKVKNLTQGFTLNLPGNLSIPKGAQSVRYVAGKPVSRDTNVSDKEWEKRPGCEVKFKAKPEEQDRKLSENKLYKIEVTHVKNIDLPIHVKYPNDELLPHNILEFSVDDSQISSIRCNGRTDVSFLEFFLEDDIVRGSIDTRLKDLKNIFGGATVELKSAVQANSDSNVRDESVSSDTKSKKNVPATDEHSKDPATLNPMQHLD